MPLTIMTIFAVAQPLLKFNSMILTKPYGKHIGQSKLFMFTIEWTFTHDFYLKNHAFNELMFLIWLFTNYQPVVKGNNDIQVRIYGREGGLIGLEQ